MIRVIKQSWIFRMISTALMLIAIEISPIVVNLALCYSRTNQLIVDGFMVLFICLTLTIIRWVHRTYETYNQLGRPAGIKVGWIIGDYLAIVLGMDVLSYLNQLIYHQTEIANNAALGSMLSHNEVITIVFCFSAVVLSPIAREFILRGTSINMSFKRGNTWPRVTFSGVIFSISHMSTSPISFLIHAYMGMVLAYVYLRTDDIRNSTAIHMINSAIAMYIPLV